MVSMAGTMSDIPVVFLHGVGGMSSIDYAHLSAEELDGHPLILIDFPGTGTPLDNPADLTIEGLAHYVAERLAHLSIQRAVIVGHSMGGAVAVSLAHHHSDLVEAIILTESNLDSGGGTWSRRITSMSEEEFVTHGYDELLTDQQATCLTWARTVSMTSPVALYRVAQSLIAGVTPSWRQILYGLTCPRFYVFGDQNLPDPDAEELSHHGIHVLTIANAGHNMVYDNPAGFTSMLRQCLTLID